jgi:hypothetical protein
MVCKNQRVHRRSRTVERRVNKSKSLRINTENTMKKTKKPIEEIDYPEKKVYEETDDY